MSTLLWIGFWILVGGALVHKGQQEDENKAMEEKSPEPEKIPFPTLDHLNTFKLDDNAVSRFIQDTNRPIEPSKPTPTRPPTQLFSGEELEEIADRLRRGSGE